MKGWKSVWPAALAVLAMGCGQASAPAPQATAVAPTVQDQSAPFPAPDFTRTSDLALLSDDGVTRIHSGDEAQNFKAAFPRSAKNSRSIDGQLPMGATEDHWSVSGYEFEDASRGVGALLYNNRIALAMRQFDDVDDAFVNGEVARYVKEFGTPRNLGADTHVHYWFWQIPPATLMICKFSNARGQTNLTEAVGDSSVMERLHMTPETASADMSAVEQLYGSQKGENSPTNPG